MSNTEHLTMIRQNITHLHLPNFNYPAGLKTDSSVAASVFESHVSLTDVSSLKRQTMKHSTGLIWERRRSEDNNQGGEEE